MKKLHDINYFVENPNDETNVSRTEFFEPPEYVVQPQKDDKIFLYVQNIFRDKKNIE